MADERDDSRLPAPRDPDELRTWQRRQEDRFEQIYELLRRAPIPDDVQARGADPRAVQETLRALVDARVALFLTREQIDHLVDTRVNEKLARIGLQMDDAHIEETGEAIRGAMRWHRLASRTLMGAAGTILLGAVYALAKKAGLPVPSAS